MASHRLPPTGAAAVSQISSRSDSFFSRGKLAASLVSASSMAGAPASGHQGGEHHDGCQDHQCGDDDPCWDVRAALGPPVPLHPAMTIAIVQTPHGGLPRSAPVPNGPPLILAPVGGPRPAHRLTCKHTVTRRCHSQAGRGPGSQLHVPTSRYPGHTSRARTFDADRGTCDHAAELGFHCALVRVVW